MSLIPTIFTLKEEYFTHRSKLHGIHHTYRVMCHCRVLGNILKLERETRLAQCAAFVHDMARRHDGRCEQHGAWAVKEKLPLFVNLFQSLDVLDADLPYIRTAVVNHSLPEELDREDPHYLTTAVLKDADALDRIRLGEDNLDFRCLRFPESIELIPFARDLYYRTYREDDLSPGKVGEIAGILLRPRFPLMHIFDMGFFT